MLQLTVNGWLKLGHSTRSKHTSNNISSEKEIKSKNNAQTNAQKFLHKDIKEIKTYTNVLL